MIISSLCCIANLLDAFGCRCIFLSWMPVLLLYEIKYLSWSSKLYVAQHIENGCGLLIFLLLEALLMDTNIPNSIPVV